MHRVRLVLFALIATIFSLLAVVASASATVVTTSTGGSAATPTIHMVNEWGHVSLANNIANIECNSTLEGKVKSHGGQGVQTSGEFTSLSFTGCTNSWHVTVLSAGTFSVEHISGHNGDLYSTGAKFSAIRFGFTCNYETKNTTIGTFTGGSPGTLDFGATIPIASGSSFLCGSGSAQMTGSYEATSALYVASEGGGSGGALVVSPDPVIFTKQGTKEQAAIENTGFGTIKNLTVEVGESGYFKGTGFCNGASLPGFGTCMETIECVKAGKTGQISVSAEEPLLSAKASLVCL